MSNCSVALLFLLYRQAAQGVVVQQLEFCTAVSWSSQKLFSSYLADKNLGIHEVHLVGAVWRNIQGSQQRLAHSDSQHKNWMNELKGK